MVIVQDFEAILQDFEVILQDFEALLQVFEAILQDFEAILLDFEAILEDFEATQRVQSEFDEILFYRIFSAILQDLGTTLHKTLKKSSKWLKITK